MADREKTGRIKIKEVVYRIAGVVLEVNMYAVIILLAVSILCPLCLGITASFFRIELDLPSDEELIDHYDLYRTQFQQAAELLNNHPTQSVRTDGSYCHSSTSSEENTSPEVAESVCASALNYFRLLGVRNGYTIGSNVWLTTYSGGLAVSGVEMGYVYTTDINWQLRQGQIVLDLDDCEDRYCFRRIDWGWYIYKFCF